MSRAARAARRASWRGSRSVLEERADAAGAAARRAVGRPRADPHRRRPRRPAHPRRSRGRRPGYGIGAPQPRRRVADRAGADGLRRRHLARCAPRPRRCPSSLPPSTTRRPTTMGARMATKRDYYDMLGIARDASDDELKRAFRRLARQLHPDVNQDDPAAAERFREVAEAYEVLADAETRGRYDRYGHAGVEGNHARTDQRLPGRQHRRHLLDAVRRGHARLRRRAGRGRHGPMAGADAAAQTPSRSGRRVRRPRRGRHRGAGAVRALRAVRRGAAAPARHAARRATAPGQVRQVGAHHARPDGARRHVPGVPRPRQADRRTRAATATATAALERRTVIVAIPRGIEHGQRCASSGRATPAIPARPPATCTSRVAVKEDERFERDGATW